MAATEWCSRDLVPVVSRWHLNQGPLSSHRMVLEGPSLMWGSATSLHRWQRGDYEQEKQMKDWELAFSGYNAEETFPWYHLISGVKKACVCIHNNHIASNKYIQIDSNDSSVFIPNAGSLPMHKAQIKVLHVGWEISASSFSLAGRCIKR